MTGYERQMCQLRAIRPPASTQTIAHQIERMAGVGMGLFDPKGMARIFRQEQQTRLSAGRVEST